MRILETNLSIQGGAIVSEQGIIQGKGHETIRLRKALHSKALIFADVGVKHAAPLADRGLASEARDLAERGLVDALIVSGALTGAETSSEDVKTVRSVTELPILIGSGATPENISTVANDVSGYIVGSYFKKNGHGSNFIDPSRLETFMNSIKELRAS